MSAVRIFVPVDAAAQSVGANEVAAAIAREAAQRGIAIELVRNGSRGMFWLEPLVEVETATGRMAYGPVAPDDVASLFDAGFLAGGTHPLGHGLTAAIPYFAKQERLSFARCGVIDPLDTRDVLGLALEVNHRLIDGLHIGRFVQDLQQRIDALAEAE